jgi:hypothetical protein
VDEASVSTRALAFTLVVSMLVASSSASRRRRLLA